MTSLNDDVSQRLQRLEKSNRRLRTVYMLTVAVVAGGLVMGQAGPRTLDVERVTIRDRNGVRITLGMESPVQGVAAIPAITMYDDQGKPRLALSVGLRGGASIGLKDELGNWPVFLSQHGATLKTDDGKSSMDLNRLGLFLKNVSVHVTQDAGGPEVAIYPTKVVAYGRDTRHISLEDGGVWLTEKGTVRAVLGRVELHTEKTDISEQRPASSLVLFDSAGKVVRAIP